MIRARCTASFRSLDLDSRDPVYPRPALRREGLNPSDGAARSFEHWWPALAAASLGAANVLAVYTQSATHWSDALRVLTVSWVAGTVIGLVCSLVLRRAGSATFASCAIVLGVIGYPLASLIAGTGAAMVFWREIRGGRRGGPLRQAVTQLAVGIFLVSAGVAVIDGAVTTADFRITSTTARVATESRPNIYLLLLDAYPRADTLQRSFGFDNEEFIDGLTALDFTVYPDAKSPSARTERTLLSMLSGPDDVLGPEPQGWLPSDDQSLRRGVRRALAVSSGADLLRAAGFHLRYVPTAITHARVGGWETTVDSGQLNDFEVSVIERSTLLAQLLGNWALEQQRSRIESSLDAFAQPPSQKPTVVLAHLNAPHAPLIYGRGAVLPECFEEQCTLWGYHSTEDPDFDADYLANLHELNTRILSAISSVTAQDPDAAIVVFSDHGMRESQPTGEWQRTFLASRGTEIFESRPSVEHLIHRLLEAEVVPSS